MLEFEVVSIGAGDGLTCARCGPTLPAHYATVEDVVARLDGVCHAWERGPGPNVVLGGPEPLKHPQLPALVAHARSVGVERLALRTDARGLAVGDNASGAVASGVRHLHVVVLGPDARSHEELAGPRGVLAEARAGMSAFAAAAEHLGVPCAIVGCVPVCRHNVEMLPATVDMLAREGALLVHLELTADLDAKHATPWLEAAFNTGVVSGAWVHVTGAPHAAMGRAAAARTPLTLRSGEQT